MMNRKLGGLIFSLTAVILILGATGAVYACPEPGGYPGYPGHPGGGHDCIDLKIRDQDEGWQDGVSGTWTAANMAPGNSYDFQGSFVGLKGSEKGRLGISCAYTVSEETPPVESDINPNTNLTPDDMASELVLTKCLYRYGGWEIDLLTGLPGGMSPRDRYTYACYGMRWQITDADGDGRITFYDLKAMPVSGLPLPKSSYQSAVFVMSVKFDETAENDLQGDRFNLTMSYNLRPW
jgi:hypothetical protein